MSASRLSWFCTTVCQVAIFAGILASAQAAFGQTPLNGSNPGALWQSAIGNANLSPAQQTACVNAHPNNFSAQLNCMTCAQSGQPDGCSPAVPQACLTAETQVTVELGRISDACPDVANAIYKSATSSTTSSSNSSPVSRAINACQRKVAGCAAVDDQLASIAEDSSAGDNLSDVAGLSSSDAQCASSAADDCQSLKDEAKDLEDQEKALQDEQVQQSKDSADAKDAYAKAVIAATQAYKNQEEQTRQKDVQISSDLVTSLRTASLSQQSAGTQLQQQLLAIQAQEDKANSDAIDAETAARVALRAAYTACIQRATALMKTLEQQRLLAKQNFTNNTGSINALTGSVKLFLSRYNQDLNQCLATDYATAVNNANDQLAGIASKLKLSFATAQGNKQAAINAAQTQLLTLKGQAGDAARNAAIQLKNDSNQQALAQSQLQQNFYQMNQTEQTRIQNAGQAAQNIQAQMAKLQAKIQLNANQVKANPVKSCTASTASNATKKQTLDRTAVSGIGGLAQQCSIVKGCAGVTMPACAMFNGGSQGQQSGQGFSGQRSGAVVGPSLNPPAATAVPTGGSPSQ